MTTLSSGAGRCAQEVEHRYGERVHVFDNVSVRTALARLGSPDTGRADVLAHVRRVYETLLAWVTAAEFPTIQTEVATRMAAVLPEAGVYRGDILDPKTKVILVDVIRGGIVPAQACFEWLSMLLPEDHVRLDHLNLERVIDDDGRVCGADLTGSKVGGPIDDAILLIPDPMGATGSTVLRVLDHYRAHHGTPKKVLVVPMIATPEFFRAVLDTDPEVQIYTARIDRGLSSAEALRSVPGEMWEQERGLDDRQYIVPGAGGVGEVLNNSWC